MSYESFLICFHDGHWDVYRSGLPLGQVIGGKWVPHTTRLPDGSAKPVDVPVDLIARAGIAIQAIPIK